MMATMAEHQPNLPLQPDDSLFDITPHESPSIKPESSPASSTTPSVLAPPSAMPTPPSSKTPSNASNGNGSAPRRPPRKSTLTQQQKNQKRQRATQDQLNTLEVEFNKNPTPTAIVRERIAQDINMTERSVQIWFQNRRAKIKNLAKKSIETGEDCDAIPESMRKYLAIQAFESGKPLSRDLVASGAMHPLANGLMMNTDSTSKVLISHLACRSLSIGSWRRISQTALDLVVFYSPAKSMFTYYIHADSSGFKIEFPFSYIKNITLDSGDISSNAEGAAQRSGGLVVELTQPPNFSMDPGTGGFFQCRDFTEDQQASQVLVHHLGGHPKVLATQLAKLVSLEPFRNRHRTQDSQASLAPAMPMSAPVSPAGIQRPASQPQHFMNPQGPNHGSQQQDSTMPPPPSRIGHKRQRSRSVPAGIDYSQFRRPMPPFMSQDLTNPLSPTLQTTDNIYAPIPQHPAMPVSSPMNDLNAVGSSHLTINTTAASFDFDFRGPMSATTVNSTDLDPSYFSLIPTADVYNTSNLNTPYTTTFLSPSVNGPHTNNGPVSPFSSYSTGDPVIAHHSPPLGSYDRSASADVYHTNGDTNVFTDDGLNYNDIYSKHPFPLPFRSPVGEPAPEPDFEFHHLVEFPPSTESASLSPENHTFASGS